MMFAEYLVINLKFMFTLSLDVQYTVTGAWLRGWLHPERSSVFSPPRFRLRGSSCPAVRSLLHNDTNSVRLVILGARLSD